MQQFLFHLEQQERFESFKKAQAVALIHVLDMLVLEETRAVEENGEADDMFRPRATLEKVAEYSI